MILLGLGPLGVKHIIVGEPMLDTQWQEKMGPTDTHTHIKKRKKDKKR
jgi:hypothetical protein